MSRWHAIEMRVLGRDTRLGRRVRELRGIALAALDRRRPLLAHVVVTRRCNLSCSYCNEYDDHSAPVPLELLLLRVDRLAELGVPLLTFTGGEPLLHDGLERLIARARAHGMVVGVITNGYLLSPRRISALADAGLDHLQVSIDNIEPDDGSKKSLRLLDNKLRMLADHGGIAVNVNSVVGAGPTAASDAMHIALRARELGLSSTVGLAHDEEGQLSELSAADRRRLPDVLALPRRGYTRLGLDLLRRLAAGQPGNWRCRAGARYLYVCEDGLVHYCSQQRGKPAVPLAEYNDAHIEHAYFAAKPCVAWCTISCAYKASLLDAWRGPQRVPELSAVEQAS